MFTSLKNLKKPPEKNRPTVSRYPATVLQILIMHRSERIFDEALKLTNVDVNEKNNAGRTAIYYAAEMGDYESVKKLIDNKADLTIVDNGNMTILHVAQGKKVSHLLLEHGASMANDVDLGRTPLHYAVELSDIGKVESLCEFMTEGDINATELTKGHTALHLATLRNHVDIVKLLLEKGAITSINMPDQGGNTPLDICKQKLSKYDLKKTCFGVPEQEIIALFKNAQPNVFTSKKG